MLQDLASLVSTVVFVWGVGVFVWFFPW